MYRGYIKLWRKSRENAMLKDHKLWALWCYILMSASHKETRICVNGFIVYIDKGQFAFTVETLSDAVNLSRQQIRTCLKKLVRFNCIEIKTTNKMTILSVVNWENYQTESHVKEPTSNQQATNEQPAFINIQEYKRKAEKSSGGDLNGIFHWLETKEKERV